MSLKLMYITNRPEIAQIAETSGVDRIFVDMEYIGKALRQDGMDTVQSHHTVEDVKAIASAVSDAEVMVRINPIHNATSEYISSKEEIDAVIENGAQVLMLPYFKTVQEVEMFLKLVDGRVKTMPLIETPESVEIIDDILKLDGIDELFIGLNDLSLGYGKKFMFELLSDGTVEDLCYKFRKKGLPFGFGGIASLGKGLLPSEHVITEHYRLGSTCAILSRSFCNVNQINHIGVISSTFVNGVREIREYEKSVQTYSKYFTDNTTAIMDCVKKVVGMK